MRPSQVVVAGAGVAMVLLLAGCGQPAYQVFAVRVASAPPAAGMPGPDAAGRAASGRYQTPARKLDLNRASAAALRRLPGASAAAIAAIMAGRPYTAKRQLLTRGVLSALQYALWKDDLVVHQAGAGLPAARLRNVVRRPGPRKPPRRQP